MPSWLAYLVGLFSTQSALAASCPPNTIPWPGEPCEAIANATADATTFLRANIFPFDETNAATYFDGGIAATTVQLALAARTKFKWAASVPREMFNGFVLPYANVNEARSNWRQLFWDALSTQDWVAALPADASLEAVALAINAHAWQTLGKLGGHDKGIVFKSEQTPLIYDPLSTTLFGYASCTGISITYIDALRTLGVPARLVGTPAWHGKVADGNHNWVEVWLGHELGWHFIEGAPAGGGETFTNPCDKWFCNAGHFNSSGTRVLAAVYDRTVSSTCAAASSSCSYPMAWDLSNHGVAGVDRSADYDRVCTAC